MIQCRKSHTGQHVCGAMQTVFNRRNRFYFLLLFSLQESYKEWLCSANLQLKFNDEAIPICHTVVNNVCLNCPAIDQGDSYGGYPIFQCGNGDQGDGKSYS